MLILSYTLISIGLLFAMTGVIGIIKMKNVYQRLLICSNIDTVGLLFIMFGAMAYESSLMNVLKILFLLVICLVTSPLSTHATMLSAYDSGVRSPYANK